MSEQQIVVVGAGPAGLGAALAAYHNGHRNVHVYELRSSLVTNPDESYPIGLNLRGQQCLRKLCPATLRDEDIATLGLQVNSWKILVGPMINVANVFSGKVRGTTRADVVDLLLKEVKYHDAARIHYSTRVIGVNPTNRTVTVENVETKEVYEVKCEKLVIADGVRSTARESLRKALPEGTLTVTQWPWNCHFRVLFSLPEPTTTLDPAIHYIMNGVYVSKLSDGRWTVATSHFDNSKKTDFLMSTEPTAQNAALLRAHLDRVAPAASALITDEECLTYFTRRMFTGAITKVSAVGLEGGWAALLGDAAHAVYPATGEGVNSALEDASVWMDCCKDGTDFNDARLADAHALSDLAYGAAKGGAKGMFQASVIGLLKKVGLVRATKEDLLYGTLSDGRIRYRDASNIWKAQTKWIGGAPIAPAS